MNVAHILSERAAANGLQTALIEDSGGRSRRMTFAELEQAAAAMSAALFQTGLRPGDSVLLLHPMSVELYVVLIALFRAGLVAVFLDPSAGRSHLDECCRVHPPRGFIGSRRAHLLRFVSPALRRVPMKFSVNRPVPGASTLRSDLRAADSSPIHSCDTDTPALIRFTSGSTGSPKAAMRTHGFLVEQQRVLARSLRLEPEEMDLTTLPVFVLANLAAGVASLIADADHRALEASDPAKIIRQIGRHRPQRFSTSPALLERLAAHCVATRTRLNGLEKVFTGGGPVFPDLLDQLNSIAPQADIVAVYGSTEAEPIAHIARNEMDGSDRDRMRSGHGLLAGFPDEAVHLRILCEDARPLSGEVTAAELDLVCAAAGQPGQIVVSGPHVQPGYLNGTGDAETKFAVNGTIWHKTGDAGYLDAHGRLWLLGRCSARIQDRHGGLHPFQVECAARQHPGVRRTALVAHDNRRVLVVESDSEVDAAALRQHLAWARIDRIAVVRHLPVDQRHNAKIDYPALQKLLARL
jgi:olefin beta-lactone synthetase